MWGAQEKSEGAHQKNFGRRFAPALCPPHLQIASDATGVTWATSAPILVFLVLSVLDLGPMYTTDRRQTRIIA